MEEIRDKEKLEMYFAEQQTHFQQMPQGLKLVQFEKGELLNSPLQPLESIYIVVEGSVSIYHITEDGAVRYVSKSGEGIVLGDIEFSGTERGLYYTEAAERVLCLAISLRENRNVLENDPLFLRFILAQLAGKLALSSSMDVVTQTLEEKVLFYLSNVQADHEISSVSQALQVLHCSRRQLQRVLKKLCDQNTIIRVGRGSYRLKA